MDKKGFIMLIVVLLNVLLTFTSCAVESNERPVVISQIPHNSNIIKEQDATGKITCYKIDLKPVTVTDENGSVTYYEKVKVEVPCAPLGKPPIIKY